MEICILTSKECFRNMSKVGRDGMQRGRVEEGGR